MGAAPVSLSPIFESSFCGSQDCTADDSFMCNTCLAKGVPRPSLNPLTQHTYGHALLRCTAEAKPAGPQPGITEGVVVATVPTLEGKVVEMDAKLSDLRDRFSKMEQTMSSLEQMMQVLVNRTG